MTVKNPPAAIARALKHAASLSRADLERVLSDIANEEGPSEALLDMAYVAGIYCELQGESRRYLTSMLTQLMKTHAAPAVATPPAAEPTEPRSAA